MGYYSQDLVGPPESLRGTRLFAGTSVGFGYGQHRYRESGGDAADRISGVHAGGLWLRHESLSRVVSSRLALEVHPELAAVQSLAYPAYAARGGEPSLVPTVTSIRQYSFSGGAVAAPSAEIELGPAAIGGQGRAESYWAFRAADRVKTDASPSVPVTDTRLLARAWVGLRMRPLVLRVGAERRLRTSAVADVTARLNESSLFVTLGVEL